MIFVEEIEKVRMIFLNENKEDVVKFLQKEGIVELKEVSEKIKELYENSENDLEEYMILSTKAKSLLNELEKEPSFLESFFGKSEKKFKIKQEEFDSFLEKEKEIIITLEKEKEELSNKIREVKEKINEIKEKILILEKIKDFNFKINEIKNLEKFFILICKNETGFDFKKFFDLNLYWYEKKDKKESVVLFLGLKEEEEEIKKILLENGFEIFDLEGISGLPKTELKGKLILLNELKGKLKNLINEEREFKEKWLEEIKRGYLILNSYKERLRVLNYLKHTSYVSVFEGYIPKKYENKIENILEKTTNGIYFVEFEKEENPPIKLSNPGFIKNFEIITRNFGFPKSNQIDPTIFIAFALPLFFGFMLSDIFYGFLIILFSLCLRHYFKNETVNSFSSILFVCGMSAIFFGFIFGSFFGELFNLNKFWFNPVKEPIKLITVSIIFGLIQINLGISLSILQKIKSKRGFKEELTWLLLEFGGILILLNFFKIVSGHLFYLGLVSFFIGLGTKIIHPQKITEIFSFFGNILSYVRLAAISLATSYIALTTNLLTNMALGISIFFAAFIFIIGHLFNCVISSVGAFVNSLRLHYVEFFSQFFEGGGKEFSPLKYEKGLEVI